MNIYHSHSCFQGHIFSPIFCKMQGCGFPVTHTLPSCPLKPWKPSSQALPLENVHSLSQISRTHQYGDATLNILISSAIVPAGSDTSQHFLLTSLVLQKCWKITNGVHTHLYSPKDSRKQPNNSVIFLSRLGDFFQPISYRMAQPATGNLTHKCLSWALGSTWSTSLSSSFIYSS